MHVVCRAAAALDWEVRISGCQLAALGTQLVHSTVWPTQPRACFLLHDWAPFQAENTHEQLGCGSDVLKLYKV
jgi:hypothetical protein